MSIYFKLVSPERVLLSEEFDSISAPTSLGQITILPNHIPLVATLMPGEVVVRKNGQERLLHVDGGFIEIRAGNQVIALADAASHAAEIDLAHAEEAKRQAEQTMKEKSQSDEEFAYAAASLERALSRIKVARKHSHGRTAPITGEGVFKE